MRHVVATICCSKGTHEHTFHMTAIDIAAGFGGIYTLRNAIHRDFICDVNKNPVACGKWPRSCLRFVGLQSALLCPFVELLNLDQCVVHCGAYCTSSTDEKTELKLTCVIYVDIVFVFFFSSMVRSIWIGD